MSDVQKPQIIPAEELTSLRAEKSPVEIDIYESQLAEIARISDPSGSGVEPPKTGDTWVYYPWNNRLLHCVEPNALFTLRTNRNRELITTEEQQKLAQSIVGVAGMSVGSGIAIGLQYAGISRAIKIADFDTLDTSNLNRLRESVLDVGRPKVDLAAEKIYELDPFANVQAFPNGLNETNLEEFFSAPKLDVVVDEIDDFKVKVKLRHYARKHQIPLIMFTSLGDNILIDVERYDQDPNTPIFNGLLGDEGKEILEKTEFSPEDIKRYSIKVVGAEYIPTKALKSVTEMGRSLVGRPQLYSTIAVDGGLATYVIRQILLNHGPKSGRYFVKFADLVAIDNQDFSLSEERNTILNQLHG